MKPGERILVTGGSGGIGAAIALAAAERGAWPLVGFCRHEERAGKVVDRCGRGDVYRIDLRRAMPSVPAVDAVVHCAAAYAAERSLLQGDDAALDDLLQVNVLGPLRLTRSAASASPGLKRIVFVLSSASFCRGSGPYALSKAAELALCRLLANELAPRGVRVDAIVPGWVDTPMAARAAAASGRRVEDVAREHPGGRILQPDDVGRLCSSLLFDHPDTPPGQLIVCDRRDTPEPIWQPLDGAFGKGGAIDTALGGLSHPEGTQSLSVKLSPSDIAN